MFWVLFHRHSERVTGPTPCRCWAVSRTVETLVDDSYCVTLWLSLKPLHNNGHSALQMSGTLSEPSCRALWPSTVGSNDFPNLAFSCR